MAVEVSEVDPALAEDRDRLSVALNMIVNKMALREDLLLTCIWNPAPVAGQPDAPAWFVPADRMVTINATVALDGAEPGEVNPLTRPGRRAHPEIIGLMSHEAAHAHSTDWPEGFGKGLRPAVAKAAVLLEEPRIELGQRLRRPMDRPFLRAQSVMLDLRSFRLGRSEVDDRWSAASAALLVLGRYDAGVLDLDDVQPVLPVLTGLLGEDDLRGLRSLWQEALDLADGDVDGLIDVATRWVDLVGEPPEPPSMGCLMAVSGGAGDQPPTEDDGWDDPDAPATPGEPGDGDGSGSGSGDTSLAEALEAVQASAKAGAEAEIDGTVDPGPNPAVLKVKAQNEADDKAQKAAEKAAKGVFDGESHTKASPVTLGSPRLPTAAERVLARQMGEALRKAQFRDRTVTHRASQTPPGRLRGREAMLGRAQRSRGALVTAQPFRNTVRTRVPEPPVSLGVMVDGSGSMMWATKIMASLAWASAHAITYTHGQAATVVFGSSVVALAKPNQPPTHVQPFEADAGWENFSAGFAALDGALNLTRGTGVRVLVVVSDGHFVQSGQPQAAKEAVRRMTRNGALVLWIPGNAVIPPGAIGVDVDLSPKSCPAGSTPQQRKAFEAADEARRMGSIPTAITAALTTALRRG